jgi:deoxyribodipyrimidine photo-lyase
LAEAPIIVWFRRDLRLADHPALTAAVAAGAPILPLFILDDVGPGALRMGGAARWWLAGSLAELNRGLRQHGGSLCLRKGKTPEVLAALTAETGARALYATRGYEPWEIALEAEVARLCTARGIAFRLFGRRLLFEPEAMLAGGKPYRVFTPFWRACLKAPPPPTPLPVPKAMRFMAASSDALADGKLPPTKPDWAGGLRASWTPGEAAARERLSHFVTDGLEGYADARDRLDRDATSRLSPHLHFGELSPG